MGKTLVSINTFNNGSTGRIMRGISEAAAEEGFSAYCAYGRGDMTQFDSETDILIGSQPEVYAHALYTRLTNKNGFGSKHATKAFLKKLTELQPDIIHLHNIHGYFINIQLLFEYLRESEVSVIWTLHDCWSFTGHCGYFDAVGCEKWKTGCFKCPQLQTAGSKGLIDSSKWNWQRKRELFTSLPNGQMTTVTPSKWLAGLTGQSYMQKYPTIVVNNGINTKVFKPTTSDFRDAYSIVDKVVLLGVASTWDHRKGLRDFIDLSLLLDERYKIILVGLSSKQLSQLPDNILGFPRTESLDDLAQIYSAADVYLNLSCEETMGLTTVEALACGTPVIVYNKTALPEFVDSGKSGFVVGSNLSNVLECLQAIRGDLPKSSDCVSWGRRYEAKTKLREYLRIYHKMFGNLVGAKQ
jgi:glycosyltransferase involved in cell wall biosynthesis